MSMSSFDGGSTRSYEGASTLENDERWDLAELHSGQEEQPQHVKANQPIEKLDAIQFWGGKRNFLLWSN